MKHKTFWQGLCASLGMMVLILDGKTALNGAEAGIELCLKTVIPSLFPFFILSVMLTSAFSGISLPFFRPLARLCRIPEGAEVILVSAFMGGYPVGAQCISQAYHSGQIQKSAAERMLAFCNNAGPAFIFGMVSVFFPNKWYAWALWTVHITSAIFVSLTLAVDTGKMALQTKGCTLSLSDALQAAIRTMATVCGWVILFRILISFLERWVLWLLPADLQVLLTGLLELSNGCCALYAVTDIRMRFLICAVMLAFGGLCVTMQTMTVTKGLSMRLYFLGKFLQTVFSMIISWGILYDRFLPCFAALSVSWTILRKMQKRSSIYAVTGV